MGKGQSSKSHSKSAMTAVFFVAIALSLTGCSKDEQATNDLAFLTDTAASVAEKATSGADRQAALKSALDYLEANYDKLHASAERLNSLKSYQLSDETLAKMEESLFTAGERISRLREDLADEMVSNAEIDQAVELIISRYTTAIIGK